MLTYVSAKSQKFQPGFFIDRRDQKVEGLIRTSPSGKAPIKDEAFIVYKDSEKGTETRFSASDLKSYVVGKDSFVVAHAPRNETWSAQELDFVKVVLNEEVKLYAINAGKVSGGSGFRISPGISMGTGIGGGGMGGVGIGYGGGIGIGGGGGGSAKQGKITYYYGANTAEMNTLTPENFNDVMSDIMGDEPLALEAIRSGKFTVGNVNGLIEYFKKLKEAKK
ncbi:hypothetical protein [Mucilaginibacter myungsuensis]|uniref:Uncharacterized protein n=1 Tax=Mucilaginibacter myungsuensis TaxID=649104 RepID=A0A929L2W8_9SPHI|nr:hypothetical protein [Mucilaginibacter myungsuensis]MBE9664658.1 hypothetical protein [Mucilaginibacter myungsuensis]MDN3601136.1 hypothetical protein [Mucilaginibacter myungsuensis]